MGAFVLYNDRKDLIYISTELFLGEAMQEKMNESFIMLCKLPENLCLTGLFLWRLVSLWSPVNIGTSWVSGLFKNKKSQEKKMPELVFGLEIFSQISTLYN